MERRKVIAISLCTFIAGACVNLALAQLQAKSSRVAFTAVVLSKSLGQDGKEKATGTKTVAINSSGSVAVRRQVWVDGQMPSEVTTIQDVESKTVTELYSATGSKVTMVLSDEAVRRLTGKTDHTCGLQSPEASRHLGFTVIKRTTSQTGSDNRTVNREEWLAPELNCFALGTTSTLLDSNGTVLGRNATETASVAVGDPPQGMFVAPEQYIERAPSEIIAEDAKRRGESLSAHTLKAAANADAVYNQRRAVKP